MGNASERSAWAGEEGVDTIERYSIRDLITQPHLNLIFGQKEIGKTTLLAYVCLNANNTELAGGWPFGVYVNLSSLKQITRAKLLEKFVEFTGGEYRRADFLQLLADGRVTVCLDNLDLHDGKMFRVVDAFVGEFPANKYVIATTENIEASIGRGEVPTFQVESKVAYIHSFGRKQTRQLSEKWFGETTTIARARVDNILRMLRRLNVPRTPFLITILLWIEERQIPCSPVNHAALIDTFVDGFLEKLYESKERGGVDSTIKRHFLSEFALLLYRKNTNAIPRIELEKFAVDYLNTRALSLSAFNLLQELYQKGMFLELGDEITFKFDCFRSFFLALNLESAQDLREQVFSIEGFDALTDEIDLFTGLYRNKKEYLEHFVSMVVEAQKTVCLGLPLSVFDEIDAIGSPLSEEKREMILRDLKTLRPTQEQQEKMLERIDDEAPKISASDARQRRKPLDTSKHGTYIRFLNLLKMCSVILRNSELVDDANLKHRTYDIVVDCWAEVLVGVVLSIDLSEDASHDTLRNMADLLPPEHVKHFVKMAIPLAILSVIRESVGTPKLEAVIGNHLNRAKYNIQRIIDTSIIVDLEFPNYLGTLRGLVSQVTSRYEFELLYFKALRILILGAISEQQAREVEALVSDIFTRISSSGNKRLDDMRRQSFMQQLKKRFLIGGSAPPA